MKYILAMLGIAVLYTVFNPVKIGSEKMRLQKNQRILAFGDSLTYGYGATIDESYPSILARKTGREVVNAGINGETSGEGRRRLPGLLDDGEITLIILCFGGNDILQKLPMTELKENLKQMIIMAKRRGIAVLLVSVPNLGLFGLSALPLYEEVASETGVPLLSGMLTEILSQPTLKSDQIHPNAAGYRKMAEKIYAKLQKELWI